MRFLLLVFAICAGLVGTGKSAEAQNYPWCALYDMEGGGQNCGFTTYQQCQAGVEWGRRLLPAEYAIRASTRAASINESEALSLLNGRLPTSPGSLAIFAAIRRAPSCLA